MAVPPIAGLTTALQHNPAGWPEAVLPVFERAVTVEYASLSRARQPVTFPVTPYVGEDGRTLDVSTGLTYPTKAERARRNPKVCLLYSDPVGAGLDAPPVVLVQGQATIRDADLQTGMDRYVRLALGRFPEAYQGQPKWLLRQLDWYFARIWVQVTPSRIFWWPGGRVDEPPREWAAPLGTTAPPSDPAPGGKQPPAWAEAPADWRATAAYALERLPLRDLTWVGPDGFPVAYPVAQAERTAEGFRLQLGRGVPGQAEGPACLTFHAHPRQFTGQENRAFVGRAEWTDGEVRFGVERPLGDWSLGGNKLVQTVGFLLKGRKLAPRLRAEAARRGQGPPKVRLPGDD
jgi:hypothetical protein